MQKQLHVIHVIHGHVVVFWVILAVQVVRQRSTERIGGLAGDVVRNVRTLTLYH